MKIKTIILIDDSHATNVYHKMILKRNFSKLDVKCYTETKDALDYINSSYFFPDQSLIFLDINMPEMDGWEFLSNGIDSNYHSSPLKLVILTTSYNPEEENKSKQFKEVLDFKIKPLKTRDVTELNTTYF
ncbi:MAG: response regulator [Vicingaceae bacterium]